MGFQHIPTTPIATMRIADTLPPMTVIRNRISLHLKGLCMLLLLHTIFLCLHVAPYFNAFWHFNPYIFQHFNNVCNLLPTSFIYQLCMDAFLFFYTFWHFIPISFNILNEHFFTFLLCKSVLHLYIHSSSLVLLLHLK